MKEGRSRLRWFAAVWLLPAVMLCACAGPQPLASGSRSAASATAAPKRITLVMLGDPPSFYSKLAGSVPGIDGLQDLVHAGLATMSDRGDWLPVLGEAIPTVENGRWKLLPDGQMETAWTIQPNARWHDGVPFTADDLVFTIQVSADKELSVFNDPAFGLLDGVEARDTRTIVARWKQPFIWADRLFTRAGGGDTSLETLPLPKHLLEGPYNDNKSNLLLLPYWNQEFVGTGPFKVRELVPGSRVLLAANDQYVLGRPRIDEIEVEIITDSNAIVVNMLAGVVDMTLGRAVSLEQAIDAQHHGALKAEGVPFFVYRLWPQFIDPRPAVVGDVRFRRALLYAINRQEMIDSLEAGLTVVPRSILPPSERYREAEAGVPQYPYDPPRALQLIEELGYVKRSDGSLRAASGESLGSIEIRLTAGDDHSAKMLFSVTDYWERLGLAVEPNVISQQQSLDRAYRATRPAFQLSGGPSSLSALAALVSSQVPRPETNFAGNNYARYASSDYDALYQRFLTTIPQSDRTQVLAQLLQHFTTNFLFLPLYYRVEARLVANRLMNVAPSSFGSSPAWDVHQWDVP